MEFKGDRVDYTNELENVFFLALDFKEHAIEQFKQYMNPYEQICLFGVGSNGREIFQFMMANGLRVNFFCDNNSQKWGRRLWGGIICHPPSVLENAREKILVIVATETYKQEIVRLLKVMKVSSYIDKFPFIYLQRHDYYLKYREKIRGQIVSLMKILSDYESQRVLFFLVASVLSKKFDLKKDFTEICTANQYFPEDIFQLTDAEIFVDVGGYKGETLEEFIGKVKGNFQKAYSFELDHENFRCMEIALNDFSNEIRKKISIFRMGLWECKDTIKYNMLEQGSAIDASGDSFADVDAMDSLLQEEKVSFIKMDIEGAELEALKGASQIIKRHKPKLAISIYHKNDDLWKIPLYIKSLVPEYKIYIRQHTKFGTDTVCYAVVE